MRLKSFLPRLVALVMVVVIGLMGCSPSGGNSEITGNYRQDTLDVIQTINTAIAATDDPSKEAPSREEIRDKINGYISRYRRDGDVSGSRSFTTMQTALNSLAGFYSSYSSRPLSDKLKKRLKQEFARVEASIKRGS